MLKIILIVFFIVYIGNILSSISKNLKMKECIAVLVAFLDVGNFSSYGTIIKNENFDKYLEELLRHYPKICKFRSFHDPSLSYGKSSAEIYIAATELYHSFLMKQNFLINDLFDSFNPINTVKKIITLPNTILKFYWFPQLCVCIITLNIHHSRLFNLAIWVITYALGMYQNEIKAFLSTLLKHS